MCGRSADVQESPGKVYTCWIYSKVRVRQGSRLEEEEAVIIGGGDRGRDGYLLVNNIRGS